VLTCVKVLDFVQFKDQTKIFLEVLLVATLQTALKRQQASGDAKVAEIFGKAREEQHLVTGLRYILSKAVGPTKLVTSPSAKRDLQQAIRIARSALVGEDGSSA
jgi:hypothetical protein